MDVDITIDKKKLPFINPSFPLNIVIFASQDLQPSISYNPYDWQSLGSRRQHHLLRRICWSSKWSGYMNLLHIVYSHACPHANHRHTIFLSQPTGLPVGLSKTVTSRFDQGPRHRGGNGGMCPPTFFKSEKSALFLGLNAPFKERKKYFLNKRPLFLERKCPFRSSKGHFRNYRDSIFSKIFVRLVNVIKSFDFGHIQKCPFWSMPLHFRNASAASGFDAKEQLLG
jgi:hypothetical protein